MLFCAPPPPDAPESADLPFLPAPCPPPAEVLEKTVLVPPGCEQFPPVGFGAGAAPPEPTVTG